MLNLTNYATKPPPGRLLRRSDPLANTHVASYPHNGMAQIIPASAGAFPPFNMTAGAWGLDAQGATMKYNGSTTYGTQADAGMFQFERTQKFSVSLWASGSATAALIGNADVVATTFRGWEIALVAPGASGLVQVSLVNTTATNALVIRSAAGSIPSGALCHIVWVYTGGSAPGDVLIYINGVTTTQGTITNNLSATTISAVALRIGARNGASPGLLHNGNMGNINIIPNRAITPWEVKRMYYTERMAMLDYARKAFSFSAQVAPPASAAPKGMYYYRMLGRAA